MAGVDASLAKGDPIFKESLDPKQVAAYRSAFSATLDGMNEKSLAALEKNMQGADFYPAPEWLSHSVLGPDRAKELNGQLLGAWQYDKQTGSGRLHLDGGVSSKSGLDSIRHVYAHEISHAIDWIPEAGGGGREISGTPRWIDAYSTEIKTGAGKLSKYAETAPAEGFAEFGRLVNMAPDVARTEFPKSWAVWKKHGLVD